MVLILLASPLVLSLVRFSLSVAKVKRAVLVLRFAVVALRRVNMRGKFALLSIMISLLPSVSPLWVNALFYTVLLLVFKPFRIRTVRDIP